MPWNLDSDRPIYLQLMERFSMILSPAPINPGTNFLLFANLLWKHP